MTENDKIAISVLLDSEVYNLLRIAASTQNKSLALFTREYLTKFVKSDLVKNMIKRRTDALFTN